MPAIVRTPPAPLIFAEIGRFPRRDRFIPVQPWACVREVPAARHDRLSHMREDHASNWFGLAALSLGMVLLFMNTTMINVALPALSAGLGASTGGLEWVVSSYNLAFLVVLLPGGALGDRLGHRRLLVAGVVGFCAAGCVATIKPPKNTQTGSVLGYISSVYTCEVHMYTEACAEIRHKFRIYSA